MTERGEAGAAQEVNADSAALKEILDGKFEDVDALIKAAEEEEERLRSFRQSQSNRDHTLTTLASVGVKV